MISQNEIIKRIFGFKIKYLRQKQNLSYEELADRTGLSRSYLHDIEKGRKYPKVDKISTLASALDVSYDWLVSVQASKRLQPVIDLLSSDFMKEFPLEQFGIEPDKLFELFSNTPNKVNAFISTIVNVTRNYQLQREHFYMAALRSYQDLHDNYFHELEDATERFKEQYNIKSKLPFTTPYLERLLKKHHGITVDRTMLSQYPSMEASRYYFSKEKSTLYLNTEMTSAQENFLIGRELGFQQLQLQERPFVTRLLEADSFEILLNNFKASYFSIALLMNEKEITQDFQEFLKLPAWDAKAFLSMLNKYDVTPEMLMQRLTNILPHHFSIKNLFFIRMIGAKNLRNYKMTKELHLSQLHNPYANKLNEHYCRRWVSLNIIKNHRAQQTLKRDFAPIADAQISQYWDTPNEYLCISIATTGYKLDNLPTSVTLGLLINDELKRTVSFLSDPELPVRQVNTTCERCSIPNCEARAAAPVALEKASRIEDIRNTVKEIDGA